MTRINLLDPSLLTDQHLIAEYRELPRVFTLALKAYGKPVKIPANYVLGTGHVKFFYNKLKFLEQRQNALIQECKNRGFNISFEKTDFIFPKSWYNDYIPSETDIMLSKSRLDEKIAQKPDWYKYYGKKLESK
ncbi:endonuclease V [Proteus phage vB_PmiM_Pm5461]|uniref:Endonuclease V n=1 Tax=Proteus phage vB_PmiM_Pm5461 TaxID=1636250 RepID=A0A0G2SSJ2_9CAUD|nr:endonuclease V N-glycosylase UV repair enzyme [Proteus phage vB_PmiM_Pm5461]AKA61961.1 endonuclease V [Proteus phage vB_PmiM_Pm5461]